MKKLLLSLLVVCLTAIFANAQDAPKKATVFAWNTESLTEIGVSTDQIKQIAKIKKDFTATRKKVEADAALDEKAKKDAVKAALKERNAAMKAVLTEEQNKKVDEINAKLKEEAKAAKEAKAPSN